jgi:arylsulfatase
MDSLQQTGVADNTLVLFISDNGGCAEELNRGSDKNADVGTVGSFTSYGLPWANASNTPFRLFKHWQHEGGISAPCIAYWPGRIQPNTWSDEPSHVVDVITTFIDVGGAKYPANHNGKALTPLVGRSLVGAFAGQHRQPVRPLYWEHEGNRAVRVGNWKLVARDRRPWELYDMSKDRSELHDLAGQNPQKAAELQTMWDAWSKKVGVIELKDPNRTRDLGNGKKKGKKAEE